jgi:hypothetical protein
MRYLMLLLPLLLTGCAGRYTYLNNPMTACGFRSVPYLQFADCMEQKITVTESEDPNDYYNKSALVIRGELDGLRAQVKHKDLTSENANDEFSDFVNGKIAEEKKSAQTVAMVGVVVLGGALIAECAHTNSCGGSQPNNHQGCCSWHHGIMPGACSAGHLVCNDGQISPSCPC